MWFERLHNNQNKTKLQIIKFIAFLILNSTVELKQHLQISNRLWLQNILIINQTIYILKKSHEHSASYGMNIFKTAQHVHMIKDSLLSNTPYLSDSVRPDQLYELHITVY